LGRLKPLPFRAVNAELHDAGIHQRISTLLADFAEINVSGPILPCRVVEQIHISYEK
jgi:hypothetical protein